MPKQFTDPESIADNIIREVGTDLVVGLPLALGKANHIVNALYARAVADRSIRLTFFSALTLEKPRPSNLLERRFISPVIDRLFGGYPDLAYADALRANQLPPKDQASLVGLIALCDAQRMAMLLQESLYFSLGEGAFEFGFAVLDLLVQVSGEFFDDIILLCPGQVRFDGT